LPFGSGEAAPNEADGHEPIKIGFITSLSGVAGDGGQAMVNGVNLYLDQIKHSMAGRRVELLVENDGSNPATAVSKFKKLAEQDKVCVVDGFLLSHIGAAAANCSDQFKMPTVLACAADDELTQRKSFSWMIRTGWSASQPLLPFGEWVYKKLGYRRVAVLACDYSMGWDCVGGFQKTFEEAGGKVVQKIWVPLGFREFSSYLGQLRTDVDAVFILAANGPTEYIIKQYHQKGINRPIIGGGPTFDESTLEHVGKDAVGAINAMEYSPMLATPINKAFVAAYRAKFQKVPSHLSEFGYASAMWIHKAVDLVHGNVEDKTKFMAALKNVGQINAPRGPIRLDSYNNPIENIYVRRVDMVDGEAVNTVIHTFPMVSQFYKYKPEQYLSNPAFSKEYPPCRYCNP